MPRASKVLAGKILAGKILARKILARKVLATSGFALLAGLLLAAAASGAEPQLVTLAVELIDDQFVPNHLVFRHGVHYRLHLENHGTDQHEFTAPVFFASAGIDNPAALNREQTEVVLQPGESRDVFLTPQRPGTYPLICADHDWDGMTGDITVE
jgi:uncharacterized cupredoxin-like copper-binding protein